VIFDVGETHCKKYTHRPVRYVHCSVQSLGSGSFFFERQLEHSVADPQLIGFKLGHNLAWAGYGLQ